MDLEREGGWRSAGPKGGRCSTRVILLIIDNKMKNCLWLLLLVVTQAAVIKRLDDK
jgi:hypothetical protein